MLVSCSVPSVVRGRRYAALAVAVSEVNVEVDGYASSYDILPTGTSRIHAETHTRGASRSVFIIV